MLRRTPAADGAKSMRSMRLATFGAGQNAEAGTAVPSNRTAESTVTAVRRAHLIQLFTVMIPIQ